MEDKVWHFLKKEWKFILLLGALLIIGYGLTELVTAIKNVANVLGELNGTLINGLQN